MTKGPNNHGDTLVSSDEQDATRRKNKANARKRPTKNRNAGLTRELGHEKQLLAARWSNQPRLGAVRPRKTVEHEQHEQDFRVKQAQSALTSTNITSLEKGCVARQIAEKTLALYPTVAANSDVTDHQRLKQAVSQARQTLSYVDPRFDNAVKKGTERAFFALNRAKAVLSNKLTLSVPR